MAKDLWSFARAAASVVESRWRYRSIRWLRSHLGSQLYFSGDFTFRFLPAWKKN